MILAIVGSRNLNIEIAEYVPVNTIEIVSGGAKGIDTLAKGYAHLHGITLTEYIPEYKKYGRNAPLVRNKKIVDYADSILFFWDGKSKGTKFTMEYAKKSGKPIHVIIVEM